MNHRRRRWPLLVLLLVAACARPEQLATPETGRSTPVSPPVWASALPSSPAPYLPRCIGGREISLGEPEGAMGLRAGGIKVRNCGKKPWTVNGYPVLDVLGEDRKKLDVSVLHGVHRVAVVDHWNVSPKRITVAPGQSVSALLIWRNLTTDAEKTATGAYLSIAAAGKQTRHTIPYHLDAGNTGKVALSPWTRPAPASSEPP